MIDKKITTSSIYFLGDNIDTDQIVTAEYMKINPSTKEGYEELGGLAMCGLSDEYPPFIDRKTNKAIYKIIIAGENFGCGSSREHAPIALGASGVKIIVAKSFARIFYRNCISTGEILPLEIEDSNGLSVEHGNKITIDLEKLELKEHKKNKVFKIKDFGDLSEIIKSGGLFPYAKQIGIF